MLPAALAGAVMFVLMAHPAARDIGHPLILTVIAGASILVLRRWPLPVLVVLTVATAVIAASGAASLAVGLLLGLALYFSAVELPRRRSIPLAVAIAVVLGAGLLVATLTRPTQPVAPELIEDVVPLAGAWFIADAVAARRRYQVALAWQIERERLAEVQKERVRIAREMHDVVAHTLAVITVQAGVGRRLADKRPQEAIAALDSIETIGRTAQEELRVVLGLLRDGETAAAPLAPAPGLGDLKDLVETVRASGTPVELSLAGTDRSLSPALELSVYRVVQEALTNVVKHAPGARAAVELRVEDGKVRLAIRDDGGPRAGGQGEPGGGHGVVGMRERVGAFGGWLAAGPSGAGGFLVSAEIPVEETAR
jgi:signal transduction histidine kinase